jgi:hypothetical protein
MHLHFVQSLEPLQGAGLEEWAPSDTLVKLINELRAEGKL